VVVQQQLQRATFPLQMPDKTVQTESGANYTVLNALNSATLPDGKYLYNRTTGNIEAQWVQGIGSTKAPAPQARLMATVINGILTRKLPWGLVLLGVFLVIAVELLGVRSLSFAVGAYLPIGTTLAIFCGGVMRWLAETVAARVAARNAAKIMREANAEGAGTVAQSEAQAVLEQEVSPGALYASGLIAAGGIVGLLGVALKLYESTSGRDNLITMSPMNPLHHDGVSVVAYGLLMYSLYYFARKPMGKKDAAVVVVETKK
jgi:hypothetical protein